MSVLNLIFFAFLAVVATVSCTRAGKLAILAVNRLFDRIEDWLLHPKAKGD